MYKYKKVSINSKNVEKGDLFFALLGERVDGHDFLSQAAERGAYGAVVSKKYAGENFGLDLFYVDDTLLELQGLAKEVLSKRSVRVVGVTGSFGKTTTRDFIATLLSEKYCVDSSPHNYNGKIGLPLSILNSNPAAEILVLEMGIDSPEGLPILTDIAPPEVGVLVSADFVHAEFFKDLEEITTAKHKIFEHPKTKFGVVNDNIKKIDRGCKKVSFSLENSSSDYFGNGDFVIFEKGKQKFQEKWTIPAKYYQSNFLAAVAVARYFDLSWVEISQGFKKIKLPERRLEVIEKQGITFVNDSYNACQVSMLAALRSLPKPSSGGKTVAVLGSMAELGDVSEKCHYNVGEVALEFVDEVLCIGKECRPIYKLWKAADRVICWPRDKSELVSELKKKVQPGDVVLLKGSNSHKLWEILEWFSFS